MDANQHRIEAFESAEAVIRRDVAYHVGILPFQDWSDDWQRGFVAGLKQAAFLVHKMMDEERAAK